MHHNHSASEKKRRHSLAEHMRYVMEIGVASQPAGIETLIEVTSTRNLTLLASPDFPMPTNYALSCHDIGVHFCTLSVPLA